MSTAYDRFEANPTATSRAKPDEPSPVFDGAASSGTYVAVRSRAGDATERSPEPAGPQAEAGRGRLERLAWLHATGRLRTDAEKVALRIIADGL